MSVHTSLPILVFDGDCGFCTTSARFLARWVVRRRSTATKPATEPATEPATQPATQPVTQRAAQPATAPATGPAIEPWQHLDLAELGLTPDQCTTAVQWVAVGGEVASGHQAIAAVLRAGHPVWRPVGALIVAPGFGWLAGRVYSWVADHRYALPGGTPACRTVGRAGGPAGTSEPGRGLPG